MRQDGGRGASAITADRPRVVLVGLAALVLLGAVAVAAREAGPLPVEHRTLPLELPTVTLPPMPDRPDTAAERPTESSLDDVGLWYLFVLAFVLMIIVVLVYRMMRRRRDRDELDVPPEAIDLAGDPGPTTEHLRHGALRAEDELTGRPPGDLSDGVVAAWLALEAAAASSGTPRSPAATPAEFTVALLARHRADPDALAVLLGLYQRARFGHEQLPAAAAEDALGAVRAIAASLGAPAPAPAP